MIANEEIISQNNAKPNLTPIGQGCWQFSQRKNLAGKFWPFLEDEVIRAIVKKSFEGGINWFDTAEMYGGGQSEKMLAQSLTDLGKKPGDFFIATKWSPLFRFASNIISTIDERLKYLDPFPIDLYQVHQPWSFSSATKEMDAMAKLVQDGKIKHVGVSNFSAKQMRIAWEALQKYDISLFSNQIRFSLLDRSIESNGVLETAKHLGIKIVAYSPLAQGLINGKFHDNTELIKNIGFRRYSSPFGKKSIEKSRPVIDIVKKLALKYEKTPSQIALNWVIRFHGDTIWAIPGASKPEHAAENAGAMNFSLASNDLALLDDVSKRFK